MPVSFDLLPIDSEFLAQRCQGCPPRSRIWTLGCSGQTGCSWGPQSPRRYLLPGCFSAHSTNACMTSTKNILTRSPRPSLSPSLNHGGLPWSPLNGLQWPLQTDAQRRRRCCREDVGRRELLCTAAGNIECHSSRPTQYGSSLKSKHGMSVGSSHPNPGTSHGELEGLGTISTTCVHSGATADSQETRKEPNVHQRMCLS